MSEIAATLSSASFFRGLPLSARERMSEVCRVRVFNRREVLFMEGAKAHAMYLLLSGCVQLRKTTAGGDETVIRTLQELETFAEVVLFEESRYPVTATALTDVRVLELPRADVRRLLDDRGFRDAFITMLMSRQRYLAERVGYLSAHDVEERFYLFVREQYGAATRITVNIPKKDIAAAIGATPETFSRLIQRLKATGALSWRGRTLALLHTPPPHNGE